MKRFLLTLLLGSLFATLGEYLFCVLVRQDTGDYLFTLAAYPAILSLTWLPVKWIERRARSPLAADVGAYLFAGLTGLAIEWFIIGNSPWSNPQANDLGMYCFWTVVLAMPRLLLDDRPRLRRLRVGFVACFLAYAALSLAIGFTTPQPLRLFVLVWVVVIGYVGLNLFFLQAFWIERRNLAAEVVSPPSRMGT